MKKSEIQVGQDYAEQRGSYGGVSRVRVVSLDGKVTQGWGYSKKTISGTVVRNVQKDGTLGPERTVPNRQITELWAPYAKRQREIAERKAAAADAALRGRIERAGMLLDLIPTLRHAGLPDTETRLWDRESKFISALEHVGLLGDIITKDEESERGTVWGDQYTLKCPLSREIEDFVVRGDRLEISADDLLMILK